MLGRADAARSMGAADKVMAARKRLSNDALFQKL
jgi:hypothetical protein